MRASLLATLLVLLTLTSACADMTDAQVRAAMSARKGVTLTEQDLGILRPQGFPNVVVVGFFAHDRGYAPEGVFVGEDYGSLQAQTPKALAAAGWAESTAAQRQNLALQWTEHGLLAWQSPLSEAPKTFGDHAFEKPSAVAQPGGGIVVTLWVQRPAGMRPVFTFVKMAFEYTAQGAPSGCRVLESFETDVRH